MTEEICHRPAPKPAIRMADGAICAEPLRNDSEDPQRARAQLSWEASQQFVVRARSQSTDS